MPGVIIEAHDRSYQIINPGGLIGKPIAEGRPYEQKLLEGIYEEGFGGTIIDAGAHVGNHTLWFAAICRLHVEAFEPTHYPQLGENVSLNPNIAHQVKIHACALGEQRGWASLVGKDRLGMDAEGMLPVRTIDEYEFTNVSAIKADVEDMEPQLLRGALQTIEREQPILFLEARDEACHEALAEVLEPLDYVMTTRFRTATPVERWAPA